MSGKYTLDQQGNPVLESDILKWAQWYERRSSLDPIDRTSWRVGYDQIGKVLVSTVFLGLDHALDGGPPVLWETLVRGGVFGGEVERYNSRDEAKAGHARWMSKVNELTATTP